MPKFTIRELIKQNENIIQYYKNGLILWNEIKNSPEFENIESLIKKLEEMQSRFESECGGKYLGREIMAFVGIGQFSNELIGFDIDYEDAIKVKNAIEQSYCSIEVKWYIENAIKHFGLDENKNNE